MRHQREFWGPEPVPITSIVANNAQLRRYLRCYKPD
jgi:hypothetical protein